MKTYKITFRVWDDDKLIATKTQTLFADDVEDAAEKFYKIWNDGSVYISKIELFHED